MCKTDCDSIAIILYNVRLAYIYGDYIVYR